MHLFRKRPFFLAAGVFLLVALSQPAHGAPYPLPFDPFVAGESFGCKRLLVPGAEILPHDPVIDARTLPGWREVPMKDGKNRTIESLVIKGSQIVRKKDKDGQPAGPPLVLIPAGGLVYDATPLDTHLPVGDRGVLFGKTAILEKKDLAEETCRNFSVLAGRSFPVGDSMITYLMPGPKGGPLVLWRTVDGVSVRPHPLDLYPAGKVPPKTSTRIFGVYIHAGQIAEFQSFSAPYIGKEVWTIDGKKQTITADALWFPHFRIVPVSCPIGHHIGLMVTNDVPILLDPEHPMTLFDGYLTIRLVRADSKSGTVLFSLNGRSYTGTRGIDGLFGTGRAIAGIRHTLDTLKKLEGGT
jgi:hypothetical protein